MPISQRKIRECCELITEIVQRRNPNVQPTVDAIRERLITYEECEALQDLLTDELMDHGMSGFDETAYVNEYGYQIEKALDFLVEVTDSLTGPD